MFGKVIVGLYNWHSNRLKNKYEKAQGDNKDRKEIEFYENLQKLYRFSQWLNKQFPNRKARKSFWKAVANGQRPIESVMQMLIGQYKRKENAKKAEKEAKVNAQEKTI